MEKIYGKCMTKNKSSTNGTQIIESAALLKLQQQKREELQKRMSESDDKCNLSRMSDSLGSPFKVGGRHFRLGRIKFRSSGQKKIMFRFLGTVTSSLITQQRLI